MKNIGRSSKGRTQGFGPWYPGSIPGLPTILLLALLLTACAKENAPVSEARDPNALIGVFNNGGITFYLGASEMCHAVATGGAPSITIVTLEAGLSSACPAIGKQICAGKDAGSHLEVKCANAAYNIYY